MKDTTTILGTTIRGVYKSEYSGMGNPAYVIFFEHPDGSVWQIKTLANAGWVYAVNESWIGKKANITFKHYKRYMRITEMELV